MKRDQVLHILAGLRSELRRFRIKSLALFGSVARDEARADSDVDLLVQFEAPATFDGYMDLKFFLEDHLGGRVDLVPADGLKPAVRPFVESEAIHVA